MTGIVVRVKCAEGGGVGIVNTRGRCEAKNKTIACSIHAAYGIDHAKNILKLCKITYIYVVTKSTKHCTVCKFQIILQILFG
jgi:hypothetical protein